MLFIVAVCASAYGGTINKQDTTVTKADTMDKIIIQTAVLNCSREKAFEYFTKNELLEQWLTVKAEVEPRVGGKYELFWNPADRENDSNIGCKILAMESPDYLNFEWKGPKEYKEFMNFTRPFTNVTVIFSPVGEKTKVTLLHTGWREGENWEQGRQFFIRAWAGAFSELEKLVNGN